MFQTLKIFELSSCDSSPSPWPLTDGEGWKSYKMSSTHPNSNPKDVLDSIRQKELMGKKPFSNFKFDPIATLKP